MLGAFAAPYIGWRGMVAVGLLPALLCLYIRAFVPESPHWLLRQGRVEEARRSLAWALQIDPAKITLPATLPPVEKTRWLEIFKYPRSIIAGCLTGLTQTGGVALALWQVTLFVMVLKITPPEASKLVIWVSISAIAGRFFCSWISDAWGRRASGIFGCLIAALFMSLAGYLHSCLHRRRVDVLPDDPAAELLRQRQLLDRRPLYGRDVAGAACAAAAWGLFTASAISASLSARPGLALIAGSSNFVKPEATLDALVPGFNYFASGTCWARSAFWLIGMETRGRTIDEIDSALTRPSGEPARAAANRAAD